MLFARVGAMPLRLVRLSGASVRVDFELPDQATQFGRGFDQLLRCFLSVVAPRVVPCAASATPAMLLVISPLPCAASLTLRDISLVVAFCSSTAVAIVTRDIVDLIDYSC